MDWFERITGFPEDDYASTKVPLPEKFGVHAQLASSTAMELEQ